jgi:long-chain acyl-CoA synthetase
MPEATAEALEGGWFHTGDIGHFDPDGYLVITDRKKDLIVTAGGKNVAPQPIENRLKTDKYISEAIVVGDRRPYLAALIVPNFDNLERYAEYKGFEVEGREELVKHPRVRDLLRRRIERHQRDAPPYERIGRFHLLERDLQIASGELTPTLKVKRSRLAEEYADEIEVLYRKEDGGEGHAPEPGRTGAEEDS